MIAGGLVNALADLADFLDNSGLVKLEDAIDFAVELATMVQYLPLLVGGSHSQFDRDQSCCLSKRSG